MLTGAVVYATDIQDVFFTQHQTALLLGMLLICVCACAPAAEGDPLLSVDDLLALEDSFSAFLSELEALAVERGLIEDMGYVIT